ncbi:MAG: NADP-dependent oxidoreductase [Clostridia bacterium]|nr:NADP-dependent oxidoreductase [Clostridia bacterium]
MRAAILNGYSKKGRDLEIKNIQIPKIYGNEVLIKVHTAGVNPLDNMIIKGEVKLIVPYKMPLVMGNEFCGTIEELGDNVSGFKKGDRVYARMPLTKIGAFSEYVAIDYRHIALVPDYLSDEEAAAVPLTALTALQSYELMGLKKDDTIFISGGTGSVGAMAIPIAVNFGAKVYTNGNGESKDRVEALGVDRFIDYKKEDYSSVLSNIDCVLDTIGERELEKEMSVLKRGGSIVSLRAMPNKEFAKRCGMGAFKTMLFGFAGMKFDKMASKKNQTYYFIFVHEDGKGLEKISKIFEEKRIKPSVDGVFALSDVNKALKKVASGGSKGKPIIKIS